LFLKYKLTLYTSNLAPIFYDVNLAFIKWNADNADETNWADFMNGNKKNPNPKNDFGIWILIYLLNNGITPPN
jgi:hypothetical protein